MFANTSRFATEPNANAVRAMLVCSALFTAIATTPTASAQAAGRYTMSPSGDGFVRLDTKTGEMSLCRKDAERWSCSAMDDPTARLTGEIEILKQENAALRAEVARLAGLKSGSPDGPATDDEDPRTTSPVPGLNLPSEQEVDKALGYFNRIFKKFRDSMNDLREGREAAPAPSEPSKPL